MNFENGMNIWEIVEHVVIRNFLKQKEKDDRARERHRRRRRHGVV